MSQRVDQACADQRALWSLILEDEAAANAAELGEIAEHLYADVAEARSDAARLRVQVHNLAGQLRVGRLLCCAGLRWAALHSASVYSASLCSGRPC